MNEQQKVQHYYSNNTFKLARSQHASRREKGSDLFSILKPHSNQNISLWPFSGVGDSCDSSKGRCHGDGRLVLAGKDK
eukprot:m.126554 g.126554  ORF g.126554 m.126554 type:complete len:78 (+) comp12995_c1_seq1:3577-3810(+)